MAKVGRLVKESSVSEFSNRLAERSNFFVMTMTKLPASDVDIFRRKLSTTSSKLVVVKRRLGHRVIEPLKISGLVELLEGSVGFILAGEDVLAAAKILMDFQKGNEEKFGVKGGVVDGQLLDKSRLQELASLPPKPVLLAQVLSMIESPLTDVIFTIERLIGDLAWAMEQAATKKPATETQSARPEAPAAAPAAAAPAAAPETPAAPPEPPAQAPGADAPQAPTA